MRTALSIAVTCLWFALAAVSSIGEPAGRADGSASFDKYSTTIRYGWLVRGPGEFDRSKSTLRLYFSNADIGTKIQACDSLSCVDESLADGAFVDLSNAAYTNYWVTLNGGRVQFSGGTNATAIVLTTNQPNHLVGKIRIDDSSFQGAKLIVAFDLPLRKTFKKYE